MPFSQLNNISYMVRQKSETINWFLQPDLENVKTSEAACLVRNWHRTHQ